MKKIALILTTICLIFASISAISREKGKEQAGKDPNSGKKEPRNVCFTEKEVRHIQKRLDKDKKIIKWQANRWKRLIETEPKIHYKIVDKKVIIQKIEFPVKNDKPLEYEVKLEVNTRIHKPTFFPLKINLGLFAESGAKKEFYYLDPKKEE